MGAGLHLLLLFWAEAPELPVPNFREAVFCLASAVVPFGKCSLTRMVCRFGLELLFPGMAAIFADESDLALGSQNGASDKARRAD